jgi:DNA-binding helix-hairpin-helix protein with protein kinase domain
MAAGGEGELFEIQQPIDLSAYVAKILYPHKRTPEKEAKIRYLMEHPPFDTETTESPIAWPRYALHNNQDEFVGFLMLKAKGKSLEVLCSARLPKRLPSVWNRLRRETENALRLRLKVCFNIAAAVQQIHATRQYVLVDLKPDNILIQSNGLITLVDTDSIEVVDATENGDRQTLFAASVTTPEYTPSEYYRGIQPTQTTMQTHWDDFSLAVIFYRILYGVHPFAATTGGEYESLTSLGDKIKEGLFVHHPDLQPIFAVVPPPHQQFHTAEGSIKQLFRQAFIAGGEQPDRRPSAQKWMQVLANHPLLLTNRNLPSKKMNIEKWEEKNWYELAVQKIRKEKGLDWSINTKELSGNDQAAEVLLQEEDLWQEVIAIYQKFITSGRILGFVVLLLLGLITKWLLPVVITMAFLPLLLISFKSVWKYYRKQFKKGRQYIRKSLAFNAKKELEHWEEMQYSYYTERTELRRELKRLKVYFNQLNSAIANKEQIFYKKNQSKITNFSRKIKQQIRQELGQVTEEDLQAKRWMKEEAHAIQQAKQEVIAKLEQQYKFSQIEGEMPLDKLETLRQDKTTLQTQNKWDNTEVALLHSTLSSMNEAYQATLLSIKKDFDHKHQLLEKGTTNCKLKIEDILKTSIDGVKRVIEIETILMDKKYEETNQNIKKHYIAIAQKTAELDALEANLKEVKNKLTALRS